MIDNVLNKLKQYYNILDLMNNGIISKEYKNKLLDDIDKLLSILKDNNK